MTRATGEPYNTFDGPGFPACHEVSQVYSPGTIDDIVTLVKDASLKGTPVRASGVRASLLISHTYLIYIRSSATCGKPLTKLRVCMHLVKIQNELIGTTRSVLTTPTR
jgi:hypothetical protein